MATIRDVAKAAGVSITTVSAALNGTAPVSVELRDKVMAAIRAVGYRPNPLAQNLRSGKSNAIGLLVPDIALPYAALLAKHMQGALADKGYGLFFSSNDDDRGREVADIQRMLLHRVAGLILMPTSLGEGYGAMLSEVVTCPAVLVDRVIPGSGLDCVADDNGYGATLLVRYLRRLGHSRIAVLGGRAGISSSDERVDGVRRAAAEAGIAQDQVTVLTAHHREEHAFRATQQLMAIADPPTALLSINTAQTRGIVKGLRSMGLTAPQDVSVASFDGFHFTEGWEPGITSLSQDMHAIADQATRVLLMRMAGDGEEPPSLIRVPPVLQIRTSCRAV